MDALLYKVIWEEAVRNGYDWGEGGWILEDNHAMINGLTRLRLGNNHGDQGIAFSDVRELFFGDDKAFMVCTPANRLGARNGG